MARTQRYTPEQVIAALEATKGMQFLAARRLGCEPMTVTNYIKRYPAVRKVAESFRGQMVDMAELKLLQSIQKGEAWGVTLCLKTLGKDRGYVERQEQTGKDGTPLQHQGTVILIGGTEADYVAALKRAGEAQRNGHS